MGVHLSPGDVALWLIAIAFWVFVLFGANLIS
jgi:hypothetical protein